MLGKWPDRSINKANSACSIICLPKISYLFHELLCCWSITRTIYCTKDIDTIWILVQHLWCRPQVRHVNSIFGFCVNFHMCWWSPFKVDINVAICRAQGKIKPLLPISTLTDVTVTIYEIIRMWEKVLSFPQCQHTTMPYSNHKPAKCGKTDLLTNDQIILCTPLLDHNKITF